MMSIAMPSQTSASPKWRAASPPPEMMFCSRERWKNWNIVKPKPMSAGYSRKRAAQQSVGNEHQQNRRQRRFRRMELTEKNYLIDDVHDDAPQHSQERLPV
jgi:hypothetical protein